MCRTSTITTMKRAPMPTISPISRDPTGDLLGFCGVVEATLMSGSLTMRPENRNKATDRIFAALAFALVSDWDIVYAK